MTPKTISRATLLNLTIVVEGLLLLIATGWSHFAGIELLKSLSFNFKSVLIGVGAGILMAASAYSLYLLSRIVPFLGQLRETVDRYLLPLVAELRPLDVISIAAVSGFCEEVFFRGVAQQTFGLVITSIAFGLFHDPSFRNISYSLLAAAYGLFLGSLFLWTGNLWTPIIAHAMHNLISLFLLRYFVKPPVSPVGES